MIAAKSLSFNNFFDLYYLTSMYYDRSRAEIFLDIAYISIFLREKVNIIFFYNE